MGWLGGWAAEVWPFEAVFIIMMQNFGLKTSFKSNFLKNSLIWKKKKTWPTYILNFVKLLWKLYPCLDPWENKAIGEWKKQPFVRHKLAINFLISQRFICHLTTTLAWNIARRTQMETLYNIRYENKNFLNHHEFLRDHGWL